MPRRTLIFWPDKILQCVSGHKEQIFWGGFGKQNMKDSELQKYSTLRGFLLLPGFLYLFYLFYPPLSRGLLYFPKLWLMTLKKISQEFSYMLIRIYIPA